MPTYYRLQGSINSAQGQALDGVEVYVLTQPTTSTAIPPTPLATIYSNSTGTVLANPVESDGLGNWFFYAATGTYTLVVHDPIARIPDTVFPDQQVVTQGGGSVTSVAMVMPAEFSVAGSPITAGGTITVTKVVQNANTIYAGPASGPAAAPTFRAAVAADLSGLGVGTVSSVGLTAAGSALFTFTISGVNPITTTGTATLNLALANQAANLIFAGPASGGSGPVSPRALVAADVCGKTAVAFSATPVFDASTFAFPTFTITLTGNVTSCTVTNLVAGQIVTFIITQDGTGGWTFAWPANSKGSVNIGTDASSVTVLSFVYDGTNLRATSTGSVNAT